MVLQGDLGGVLDLIGLEAEEVGEGGGSHGAGGADLGLAAALGAGDGGVALDEVADEPRHGQTPQHPLVAQMTLLLHVDQGGGQHAAGTAGGGGDDGAAVGVLLADGEGVGRDDAALPHLGHLVGRRVFKEHLGLALHFEAAGEHALGHEPLLHRALHGAPDLV